MKTVSVVIPTYNSAGYIAEAIESVLAQELPEGYSLETIVFDDGSDDDTREVLKPYLKNIIYKVGKHSGNPAVARNSGLRLATGEYIAFLDSDDLWKPTKLAAQLQLFDDPKTMLVYSNALTMDNAGKLSKKTVVPTSELADGESFKTLLKHNVISTSTVLMRRSVFEEAGYFNEGAELHAIEDYELWLRIAALFPHGIRAVKQALTSYRVHDASFSKTDNLTALQRIIRAFMFLEQHAELDSRQRQQLEAALVEAEQNWSRQHDLDRPAGEPLISVVMGVFNGEKHLRSSIDSILAQTCTDFEFVIIDDGSTDGSAKIIKSYKDKRIRLIQQRNHGLVYSLNKGIRLSRGTYIARQDADDISLPTRLARELDLMETDESLGVVGTYFTYVHEDTLEPTITIAGPTLDVDIKRAMYIHNPFGHGTTLMRKAVFAGTAYTEDYGPIEDYELWHRLADHWKLALVPESLYLYRLNPTGISHTKSGLQQEATARIIAEQWQKPFFAKSLSAILRDGAYYQSMDSPQAHDVYKQYVSQQIDLAKAMLSRGWFRSGIMTAWAAWRLDRVSPWRYVRPMLRGIKQQARGQL